MSFSELEHTADVRIQVKAESLDELFSEAARALMVIMYGIADEGPLRQPISVQGEDTADLMHSFLSEVLFISEVHQFVAYSADVKITGNNLTGFLRGEPFSIEKHLSGVEVKGISLSGLSITHEHDSYILEVIFDV
jgi:SHS2 domain-containing protein